MRSPKECRRDTSTCVLERDVDHLTMEVRDDGAGLPERFSLDSSRGLGLTIVQALVTG